MSHYSQPAPIRTSGKNASGMQFIASELDETEPTLIKTTGTLPSEYDILTLVHSFQMFDAGSYDRGYRFNGDSGSTQYSSRYQLLSNTQVNTTGADVLRTDENATQLSFWTHVLNLDGHPSIAMCVDENYMGAGIQARFCGTWKGTSKITDIECGNYGFTHRYTPYKDSSIRVHGSKIDGIGGGSVSRPIKIHEEKLTSSAASFGLVSADGKKVVGANKGEGMRGYCVMYLIPSTTLMPQISLGTRSSYDYDTSYSKDNLTVTTDLTNAQVDLPSISTPTFYSFPFTVPNHPSFGTTLGMKATEQNTAGAANIPSTHCITGYETALSFPSATYPFDEFEVTASTGTFSAGSFMKLYGFQTFPEADTTEMKGPDYV